MIQIGVTSVPSDRRGTRRVLRDRLGALHVDRVHISAVESVANELLGAVLETGATGNVILSVEVFALLTSVRVRCAGDVELSDEPFGVRERVLEGFAFAWGKRAFSDGSVDVWAELARPR